MLTNHLTRNFFKVITLYCCLFFGHFINAQTKGEENSCNASFVIDSGAGFFKTGTHYFKALNQGYENYRWDFGDGSIDSGQSVKHYFPKPGIYPVNLTVFNMHPVNGYGICKDYKRQWIIIDDSIVDPKPTLFCNANLHYSSNGNGITVTDLVGQSNLPSKQYWASWIFNWGDGTSDPGYLSATHNYQRPGNYLVTVMKHVYKSPCYPDTICNALGIPVCQEKYTIEVFTGKPFDSVSCQSRIGYEQYDRKVNFYNMLVIDHFNNHYFDEATWDFGDGNIVKNGGESVSHEYTYPGQYYVTLIKNTYYHPCPPNPDGTQCEALPYIVCTSYDSTSIFIKDSSNYLCNANINYVSNDLEVTVFDNSQYDGNTFYEWNFGDGTYGTESKMNHVYQYPGMYTVTLNKSYRTMGCPPGAICHTGQKIVCSQNYKMDVYVNKIDKPICKAGLIFTLDGNSIAVKSKISGYNINYMKLDYGDGDVIETNGNSINSNHTYHKSGMYELCLRIATVHDSLLPYIKMYDYCSDTYCLNFSVDEDDNITSLSESEASKLIVSTFPVPAKDRVEFNISNGKSDMTLRFYNATGKMVKEVNKVSGQNPEIEIPELIDGMYMYSLSNAEGVLNQGKIIVIK